MKHRIGDIVRIKSREWYDENKNAQGFVPCGNLNFTPDAAELCGTEQRIAEIPFNESYIFEGQDESKDMAFNDEMLEELKHLAYIQVWCGAADHRDWSECGCYERYPGDENKEVLVCRHRAPLDEICTNPAVLRQLGIGEHLRDYEQKKCVVVAELNGQFWGVLHKDAQSESCGWTDIFHAKTGEPDCCRKPTDFTYAGSPDEKELRKATLRTVKITKTYEVVP